jgi:CelD/BcsL family acetyltransferase involved in cellulose biosynthesis
MREKEQHRDDEYRDRRRTKSDCSGSEPVSYLAPANDISMRMAGEDWAAASLSGDRRSRVRRLLHSRRRLHNTLGGWRLRGSRIFGRK